MPASVYLVRRHQVHALAWLDSIENFEFFEKLKVRFFHS